MVDFGFASMGFPPEAPQCILPTSIFLERSDLGTIDEKMDEIINRLTKWEPKTKNKGTTALPKIPIDGKDYPEAVDNMNLLFQRNGWSDTLPMLPPTEERIDRLLTGTDLPRDVVLGKILPRGGIATVELIATIAAMAGCRPEYMPVLIAVMTAILNPEFAHWGINATTNSCYPVVIVNGPVAKQIRLNSGYGCLGPDPAHPAGGLIGRTIRLLMLIVGGAMPGSRSMSIFGGPARYTGIVFAEDEDGLPQDWEPLNVERGFARGSNVVTVGVVTSTVNLSGGGTATTEEEAFKNLYKSACHIRVPSSVYFLNSGPKWPDRPPGYLLLPGKGAQGLSMLGWSKGKVKTFLWEHSKVPWFDIKNARSPKEIAEHINACDGLLKENESWPITSKPENIMIIVAGGAQSGHWYWMQGYYQPPRPMSVEIGLPTGWGKLMEKAEEQLGPISLTGF